MNETAHNEIRSVLSQMVREGKVPHAMMLHEDDGGGAMDLVLGFLSQLYGGNPRVGKLIHPDIHFIFPVSGEKTPVSDQFIKPFRELVLRDPLFREADLYEAIGIDKKQGAIAVAEARSLLDKLSLSAVEGGWRSVVVYLPEKMNTAAANALLKMVEEPPEKTLFLLVTHAPESVLVTISSRCLRLRVPPLGGEALRDDLFADLLDALLRKDLCAALDVGEAAAELGSREKQKSFCRASVSMLRTLFLFQQGLPSLAGVAQDEVDFFQKAARGLKRSFPRRAMNEFDRALLLVERNVNQKIVFTDLVLKLYTCA